MKSRILAIALMLAIGGLAADGATAETFDLELVETTRADDTCDGWPAEKAVRKVFDECPHGPTP
ncbi:MAG: hypothetical protein KY455_13850 [Euryarchaeota archaeon]|nr:hypothetical protein [Euryarchaeota archaeon]